MNPPQGGVGGDPCVHETAAASFRIFPRRSKRKAPAGLLDLVEADIVERRKPGTLDRAALSRVERIGATACWSQTLVRRERYRVAGERVFLGEAEPDDLVAQRARDRPRHGRIAKSVCRDQREATREERHDDVRVVFAVGEIETEREAQAEPHRASRAPATSQRSDNPQ